MSMLSNIWHGSLLRPFWARTTTTTTATAGVRPTHRLWTRSSSSSWSSGGNYVRHFSSSRRNNNNNKEKRPPMNGGLVDRLLHHHNTNNVRATAADVQVRLVVDRGRDAAPEVSVRSLAEAATLARELKVDLVGITNMNSSDGKSLPVVKAVDYNKMVYQSLKKKKEATTTAGGANGTSSGASGAVGKQLATKEYKFKGGIGEHDLARKANRLAAYLRKGHSCKLTITASNFVVRQNDNVVREMLEQVQNIVQDDVAEVGKIRQNSPKHATVLLQPRKR